MKPEIEQAVSAAVIDLFGLDMKADLSRPDEQFGDYATNVALRLAKPLNQNPRDIAGQLAHKMADDTRLQSVQVAGPGFLNLTLTDEALQQAMQPVQRFIFDGEVIIETNNPNPFKAMHIGHAFNAIVADTIANLLEAAKARVHRVSYHGDVGAHVGKSMWSLLRYIQGNPARLDQIPEGERNSFMSRMYAEGTAAYNQDEQAKAEIDGLAEESFTLTDPLYRQVYETCKHWSFQQIDALVAALGNKPTVRRYLESDADALGVRTVHAHVPDVFVQSNGALIFPGSKYGSFDNAFVASNGRGLYAARDLGLMQLKHRDFPDAIRSYIVTAEEQRDYFKGVIKASELCLPELSGVTHNVPHGTVKLSTGKMSSRTGEVVEVGWLFHEIAKAVKARGGEATMDIVAGALRYQFLKVRVGSDVVFDINEAVSLQGNSGPYLQYAHARARSVLAKSTAAPADKRTSVESGTDAEQPLAEGEQVSANSRSLYDQAERALARKISEYSEVVELSMTELMPHHICNYLFELAQQFNRFYEHNRVIGNDRQTERIELVRQYAGTLKNGLNLLGIAAPDKM